MIVKQSPLKKPALSDKENRLDDNDIPVLHARKKTCKSIEADIPTLLALNKRLQQKEEDIPVLRALKQQPPLGENEIPVVQTRSKKVSAEIDPRNQHPACSGKPDAFVPPPRQSPIDRTLHENKQLLPPSTSTDRSNGLIFATVTVMAIAAIAVVLNMYDTQNYSSQLESISALEPIGVPGSIAEPEPEPIEAQEPFASPEAITAPDLVEASEPSAVSEELAELVTLPAPETRNASGSVAASEPPANTEELATQLTSPLPETQASDEPVATSEPSAAPEELAAPATLLTSEALEPIAASEPSAAPEELAIPTTRPAPVPVAASRPSTAPGALAAPETLAAPYLSAALEELAAPESIATSTEAGESLPKPKQVHKLSSPLDTLTSEVQLLLKELNQIKESLSRDSDNTQSQIKISTIGAKFATLANSPAIRANRELGNQVADGLVKSVGVSKDTQSLLESLIKAEDAVNESNLRSLLLSPSIYNDERQQQAFIFGAVSASDDTVRSLRNYPQFELLLDQFKDSIRRTIRRGEFQLAVRMTEIALLLHSDDIQLRQLSSHLSQAR